MPLKRKTEFFVLSVVGYLSHFISLSKLNFVHFGFGGYQRDVRTQITRREHCILPAARVNDIWKVVIFIMNTKFLKLTLKLFTYVLLEVELYAFY